MIRERPQHGTRPHYDVIPMRLSMLALISLVSVALALSLGIIFSHSTGDPADPAVDVVLVRVALTVTPFVATTLFVLELRRRSTRPEGPAETDATIPIETGQLRQRHRHVA